MKLLSHLLLLACITAPTAAIRCEIEGQTGSKGDSPDNCTCNSGSNIFVGVAPVYKCKTADSGSGFCSHLPTKNALECKYRKQGSNYCMGTEKWAIAARDPEKWKTTHNNVALSTTGRKGQSQCPTKTCTFNPTDENCYCPCRASVGTYGTSGWDAGSDNCCKHSYLEGGTTKYGCVGSHASDYRTGKANAGVTLVAVSGYEKVCWLGGKSGASGSSGSSGSLGTTRNPNSKTCADKAECDVLASLSFLGIKCESNVLEAADSLGVKDQVVGHVSPKDQVSDYCPVHCKVCEQDATAELTLSGTMPTEEQNKTNLKDLVQRGLVYMLNTSLTVKVSNKSVVIDGLSPGSVVVKFTIKHKPGEARAMESMKYIEEAVEKKKGKAFDALVLKLPAGYKTIVGFKVARKADGGSGMSLIGFAIIMGLVVICVLCVIPCVCLCFCCKCCCFTKRGENKIMVNPQTSSQQP